MTGFTRGDRVGFRAPDGRMLEGVVLRLNKKTVSIATDDGRQWNVAPGLLRAIGVRSCFLTSIMIKVAHGQTIET